MIYSHPGKLLQDHLRRTTETGITAFEDKKDLKLPHSLQDTKTILLYILIFHDAGKMTPFFQKYLNKEGDYALYKHNGLTNHGLISALIAAYQVYRFFEHHPNRLLFTTIAFSAVLKHHGNLKNLDDMIPISKREWKIIEQQLVYCSPDFFKTHFSDTVKIFDYTLDDLKSFFEEIDDGKWDIVDNSNIEIYFYFNFLYSILVYSDKYEAIFSTQGDVTEKRIKHDITGRYKKEKFKDRAGEFNIMKESIYKDIEASINRVEQGERIFSINGPTGSGKTLSALNAALKLREKNNNQKRIIYCLPFTSVIDQNADVFKEVLSTDFDNIPSSLLLTHHHLVEKDWKADEDEEEYNSDKAEFMVETWNSELVVTTFWQFFHTLFTGQNSQLKKFHNMAGSIIILDEVQAVPVKYLKLLKDSLSVFSTMFNSTIILVTATMPMIFSEEKKEINELVPGKEEYFSRLDRVKLTISKEEKDIDSFSRELEKKINENRDKRYLIICNTIGSSQDLYNRLRPFKPIYLSSGIIPKHRLEKIKKLKERNKGEIVVSTQLVEAGVDIDFDVVYRDMAPLDSINQGAGRCNRENKMGSPGEVYLVRLKDSKKTYASYIYDRLLLNNTIDLLSKETEEILENRFFEISREYFELVSKLISSHPSVNLIKSISQLKYEDAFTGKEAFRLIDNDYARADIFVEVDDKARSILEKYRKIKSIGDRWQRKNEFEKIKTSFAQYMISVSEETLKKNKPPRLDENEPYFIPYSQLNNYYDLDTGFKKVSSASIW